MGGERAAEAVIAAGDLDGLVLDVVVWLANGLLVLEVLVGHATCSPALVIVAGLRSLEVFESVASLGADRPPVLLVALGLRRAYHEVVLMLLVHW